jgi:CubicO group peptidase (beta-lactamase class C family)
MRVTIVRRCAVAFALVSALNGSAMARDPLQPLLARAMKDHPIPAMAVLVIRHGAIAEESFRGVRGGPSSQQVSGADVWHIGSDTKAMTATLVARLVERGVLAWNTPLARELPELAPAMQAAYRGITLVDMFAHRAGFKDLIDSDFYNAFYTDRRPPHTQRLAYLRMALAQPPAYRPSTNYLYSNRGPLLAAFIAEERAGTSWEALMRREIFAPLGMPSAGFGPTVAGQNLGHTKAVPVRGTKADDPSVLAPAGGVHLTMDDWGRFAVDQMKGEHGQGKLLRSENYRFLHTAQAGTIYGLGWGVRAELEGIKARFLTHAGSNGFWWARIVLIPDRESGVLIAANAGPDDGADKASEEIEKAIVPTLLSTTKAVPR